MLECPDCKEAMAEIKDIGTGAVEYRCQYGCSVIIAHEDVFKRMADNMSGVQLESIINFLVDIGYDVKYLGDGTFKKLYRRPRP